MKTKLDEAREIINEIDSEMIHLFIKSMKMKESVKKPEYQTLVHTVWI